MDLTERIRTMQAKGLHLVAGLALSVAVPLAGLAYLTIRGPPAADHRSPVVAIGGYDTGDLKLGYDENRDGKLDYAWDLYKKRTTMSRFLLGKGPDQGFIPKDTEIFRQLQEKYSAQSSTDIHNAE